MIIDYEVDKNADVFTPLPAGKYRLKVLAVEDGYSKAGDPKVNIKFGVEGQADRWVFTTLTFIPKGSSGHGIAVHALKCLGFSVDKSRVNFDSQDLVGKETMAYLVIEEYEGKKNNKVKSFDYLPDAAPATASNDEVPF